MFGRQNTCIRRILLVLKAQKQATDNNKIKLKKKQPNTNNMISMGKLIRNHQHIHALADTHTHIQTYPFIEFHAKLVRPSHSHIFGIRIRSSHNFAFH